jgi:hypothetical protein
LFGGDQTTINLLLSVRLMGKKYAIDREGINNQGNLEVGRKTE